MAATTTSVTVLITTYDYGRFIEQAIGSVLSQTFPLDKIQILVVDDGSTDDTSERVKKYGSRIEYFAKPNGGQASALNFGFARARGEIVALLDGDDIFAPSKLARICEVFQEHPEVGLVYHRTREWIQETDEYRDYEFFPVSGNLHEDPDEFVFYIPQPTTCVCFRRTSVEPLLPIPDHIRMNADCYLVALIPFLAPVLALSEFLSVYRIHGKNSFFLDQQQVSREVREKRAATWRTVIEEMRQWLSVRAYTKKLAPVRSYLDRWTVLIERETFFIDPPGRLRYLRHLLKSHRYRIPLMTWRLVLINYLDALAAVVVGYKNFPRWVKMREDLTRRARSFMAGRHSPRTGEG
jgi:glycosyltransferase involved in cell wall biosynthesis